jgi:hypothetical protein
MLNLAQQLSGREMFTFNPELAGQDDAEAADSSAYERPPSEHGGV